MTSSLDDAVREQLGRHGHRYSLGRRNIIHAMAVASGPISVPELFDASSNLKRSSIYRNLAVLEESQVVHRIARGDSFVFELAESLVGHHHHLRCVSCGAVVDVEFDPALESQVDAAGATTAKRHGFRLTGHQIDLIGVCGRCQKAT